MSITYDKSKLHAKAQIFCEANNTLIAQEIGFGTQGVVYQTMHNTAIKVYEQQAGYARERAVYERLKSRNISLVRGMKIPRIFQWDDDLLIFEMSIVSVPCVIDFGGAYVDEPPDHMIRDEIWYEQKAEEFGDNWVEAQAVIREIEYRAEIYLADVNSGNIKFPPK